MEGVHEIGNSPPPFLSKTYDMVDDLSTDSVVSWSKSNNSFIVWNVPEFSRDILPKYFKHNNFSSFVRQLNTYGYKKVDPDCWEFANEGFLRGHKHLLKTIRRRKPSQMHVHQVTASLVQNLSVESCVEVGKIGIEEEVERLKRDKSVHMEELVKLRQQQKETDHCLENVGQRLQLMDQRQQQTMSFLAKALQSPGFIAELVHQQNEGKRRITGMNKKRFPNQEEENYAGKQVSTLHDRQIVRYQPLMNEAAKALLQKILKTNASDHVLPKFSGHGINTLETLEITDLNQSETRDMPYIDTMQGIVDGVASVAPDEFSTDDVFLDEMPKLPGINDIFWDQILLASPLTGDKHEIGSLALEDGLAKEEDVPGGQEGDCDKMKRINHLT